MKPLLIALALVAGCHVMPAPSGQLDASGLPRVYKVEPHLYRGPQPTAVQFIAIRALEPDREWCDIKLNTALPGDGGHDALPAGMEIAHHPWPPFGWLRYDDEARADVKATLDDTDRCLAAGKAVYGHCLHGEDRTGLWLGLWRVRHGTLAASVFGEMRAYGFHEGEANRPGLPLFVEAFTRETGYQP